MPNRWQAIIWNNDDPVCNHTNTPPGRNGLTWSHVCILNTAHFTSTNLTTCHASNINMQYISIHQNIKYKTDTDGFNGNDQWCYKKELKLCTSPTDEAKHTTIQINHHWGITEMCLNYRNYNHNPGSINIGYILLLYCLMIQCTHLTTSIILYILGIHSRTLRCSSHISLQHLYANMGGSLHTWHRFY